ncbi:MAG: histidine phosphatase family protein [Acidimicrobiia bacterium]|nr:histidine phosphatase family protein [Acidimicrobiia bacterium]
MTERTPSFPQTLYQPEEGATQILLVRHGQSLPFVPGRPFELVDGHGDPHLSELGHYQAKLVGERLADEPIAAIYASSLTRTQQTAAPLAAELELPTVVEADLREVYLGEGEGGLLRQMSAEDHPAVLAMRAKREWSEIPGAETNAAFAARTVGALHRIASAHPGQLVAAFCHGGVIGAVLGFAAGVNPFTFNGSRHTAISHVVLNPSGWVIRSFNDGAHAGRLTADHQLPG